MKRTLALVAAIGLLATACGGDDDDAASIDDDTTVEVATTEPTEDESTADESTEETTPETTMADDAATVDDTADDMSGDDAAGDDTADEESGDDLGDDVIDDTADEDLVIVDSIDDIPAECRDLMAQMLRDLEPVVSEIDWANASMNDFSAIEGEFEEITSSLDDEMEAAGCNDFDFGDDEASAQAMLDFAAQEAPGVVGFMEWLTSFSIGAGDDAAASEVPDDCDGAIAYVEDAIASADSIGDVPMGELMLLTEALTVIGTECSLDRAQEFFDDPDIAAWLEG